MTELILNICIGLSTLILIISSCLVFLSRKRLKNYIPDGAPNSSGALIGNFFYGIIGVLISAFSLIVIFSLH